MHHKGPFPVAVIAVSYASRGAGRRGRPQEELSLVDGEAREHKRKRELTEIEDGPEPIEISLKEDGLLLAVDAYPGSFQQDAPPVSQLQLRRQPGQDRESGRAGAVASLHAKLARFQLQSDPAPASGDIRLQGLQHVALVDHDF